MVSKVGIDINGSWCKKDIKIIPLSCRPAEIPIKKPSPDLVNISVSKFIIFTSSFLNENRMDSLPASPNESILTNPTGRSDERKQRKKSPFYKFSFPVYIDIRFEITGIVLPVNTSFVNSGSGIFTPTKIINA